MSRLSGAVLILTGVGVAGYALHWSNDVSRGGVRTAQADAARAVVIDPQQTPSTTQPRINTQAALVQPPAKVVAAHTVAPSVSVGPFMLPLDASPLQAVVVAKAAPKVPLARPTASVQRPLGRAELAKELQRQLKRVGCYQGNISGVWTPVARKSMKAFTDHVNASLPVDQPDYILLAMLQGHDGQACGRGCPVGQARAQDGGCLPTAVIAAGSKKRPMREGLASAKPAPVVVKQGQAENLPPTIVAGTPFQPVSPSIGRMSLAGPKAEAPPMPGKQESANPSIVPAPVAAPEKREARRGAQRKQRSTGNQNSGAWGSRPPGWAPWSRPWAMN